MRMGELIEALRRVLATSFVLYMKTHTAHWDVEGPYFATYHELFRRIYKDVWKSVDATAEKIRQLDEYVYADPVKFAEQSEVAAFQGPLEAGEMVRQLRADHEAMLGVLEAAIDAAEATDQEGIIAYLSTRVEAHQKWRWFLRATGKTD